MRILGQKRHHTILTPKKWRDRLLPHFRFSISIIPSMYENRNVTLDSLAALVFIRLVNLLTYLSFNSREVGVRSVAVHGSIGFFEFFPFFFFCSTLIYPMAFLICLIWSDGTQTQLLPTVVTNFLSVFQAVRCTYNVHTSLLLEMKFISRYVRDWKSRLERETKSRQIHVKISREWRIFFFFRGTPRRLLRSSKCLFRVCHCLGLRVREAFPFPWSLFREMWECLVCPKIYELRAPGRNLARPFFCMPRWG